MESVKKWLAERSAKKNGLYIHYSPPKLVGIVTSAQLRQWARGGAESRLERAVLAGQGKRLLLEAESLPLANHSNLEGLVLKCQALHNAVERGSLMELQELLESDHNRRKYVTCRDEVGVGLLHKAVFYDYMDIAEYLVKNYPQLVHQKDSEGRTPLHYTAVCRDEAAAAALLEGAGGVRGARDAAGRTPAYYRGPGRLLLALPDNGDMARESKNTPGLVIKRHNIRIWCHDCDMARLQRVVWEGHGTRLLSEVSNQPVVKRFLEAVPYIMNTIRDMHSAVIQNDLEAVMKHSGDPVPPQALSSRDQKNLTVMHKAAGLGHGGILKYIANRYPQGINDIDNDGRTPLHYAAAVRDDQHTYNTLVSLGADESIVDNKNKTPGYYINKPQEIDKNILKILPEAPRTPSSAYPSTWDWKLLDTEVIVELNKKSRRKNVKTSSENISSKDTNTITTSESDNRTRVMKGSSTHEMINNLPDLDNSKQNKHEGDKESDEVEDVKAEDESNDQEIIHATEVTEEYMADAEKSSHENEEGKENEDCENIGNDDEEQHHDDDNIKNHNSTEEMDHNETKDQENQNEIFEEDHNDINDIENNPDSENRSEYKNENDINESVSNENETNFPLEEKENLEINNDELDHDARDSINGEEEINDTEYDNSREQDEIKDLNKHGDNTEHAEYEAEHEQNNMQETTGDETINESEHSSHHLEHTEDDIDYDRHSDSIKNEGNSKVEHNEDDDDVQVQGETQSEYSDSHLQSTADISEIRSAKRGNASNGRSTQDSLIVGVINDDAEQDSQDASMVLRDESVHGELLVVDNEIDPEVTELINNANMEMLATLVLNGEGSRLIGRRSRNSELQAFLDNVPTYMQKINKVHVAAREGNIRDLQAALDRRKFAIARDPISPNGATPLHVATIFGKTNIIKYLGGRFPETLSAVDFEGRTALHYASVLPDNGHYFNLVQQLGANAKDLDDNGKSAEEYRNNPTLLPFDHLLSDYGISSEDAKAMFVDKEASRGDSDQVDIPKFNTDEGKYLAKSLGDPLIKGLTEVANVKPKDPVAFLASFLHNFPEREKPNLGTQELKVERQEAQEIESEQQPEHKVAPAPLKVVRSGSRTATRPQRPIDVVTVDPQQVTSPDAPEIAFSSASRDEHGQSMLHFAAARTHARNALFQLLQESDISLGYRDELYRTARDVSIQANVPENTTEIDRWVLHLAARGNSEKIMQLLMAGYDHIIDVVDEEGVSITDVIAQRGDDEMSKLLASIPAFEESREALHGAVRHGDLADVEAALSGEGGHTLASSQNSFGRTALHIAVLAQHEEIVAHLAQNYPDLLRVGDNLERTPLHYAMGVEKLESLSRVLIRAGAKRVLKDLKGRQPTYYFMNKSDILRLKEEELN